MQVSIRQTERVLLMVSQNRPFFKKILTERVYQKSPRIFYLNKLMLNKLLLKIETRYHFVNKETILLIAARQVVDELRQGKLVYYW